MKLILLILCFLVFFVLILFLLFRWKPRHLFLKVLRFIFLAIFTLLLAGFGLLGGTVFWMADPYHFKDPSDEKLISLFYQHRGAFEKLIQMAREDSRHGYYFSGRSYPREKHLSESKIREYQTMLRGIGKGIDMEVAPYTPLDVQFVFSSSGLLAIGPESFKGIEFLSDNKGDGPVVKSLDKLDDLPDGDYYRPITNQWFIFYTYCD